MRDDLRGLVHLLQHAAQLADDLLLVPRAEFQDVDSVAHKQADVVEGVVELMGDTGGQLAERGELPRMDELLLFVTKLLFAPLHLRRGLAQIPHDVNHGLAAGLQTQIVLMRSLQYMQQRPPRVVEPLGLAGYSSAVLLVIGQDVKHRLPLVREALVGLVQVTHDVEHCAALPVALPHAAV